MDEKVLEIVSEALAQHPEVKQVLGCMNKGTDGLYITIDGVSYVLTLRTRQNRESFTFYELPDLGVKGTATNGQG
jgi:hypothetical protein